MSRGLERLDVRLDKFLRGQLSGEVYERVVSSEPCVLSSPEEKRVHRYAVLGHKCVYSTEFPPKNLKTLLKLEDIVAVDLVSVSMVTITQHARIGKGHRNKEALVSVWWFTMSGLPLERLLTHP